MSVSVSVCVGVCERVFACVCVCQSRQNASLEGTGKVAVL